MLNSKFIEARDWLAALLAQKLKPVAELDDRTLQVEDAFVRALRAGAGGAIAAGALAAVDARAALVRSEQVARETKTKKR